jgi:hypothetical protein
MAEKAVTTIRVWIKKGKMKSAVVFTVTFVFSIATVVELLAKKSSAPPIAKDATIVMMQNFNINLAWKVLSIK